MTENFLNRPGRCPVRATPPSDAQAEPGPELVQLASRSLNRRTVLKVGGIGAMAATVGTVGAAAWTPLRAKAAATKPMGSMAQSATGPLPDIQFDIGAFVHPAQTIAGVLVDFGVLYTFLAPAALTRNPSKRDQAVLASAMNAIEQAYAFSPSGVFTFIAYGVPYFNRLPKSLVASAMPRLTSNTSRFALEEAVAGPTDVSPLNPGVTKRLYNVPVQIEANDVLFTLRSDSLVNITEVAAWFNGDIFSSTAPVQYLSPSFRQPV